MNVPYGNDVHVEGPTKFSHIRIAFSDTYTLQILFFFWLLRKYDAFVMYASFGGLRGLGFKVYLELTKIQWSHDFQIIDNKFVM